MRCPHGDLLPKNRRRGRLGSDARAAHPVERRRRAADAAAGKIASNQFSTFIRYALLPPPLQQQFVVLAALAVHEGHPVRTTAPLSPPGALLAALCLLLVAALTLTARCYANAAQQTIVQFAPESETLLSPIRDYSTTTARTSSPALSGSWNAPSDNTTSVIRVDFERRSHGKREHRQQGPTEDNNQTRQVGADGDGVGGAFVVVGARNRTRLVPEEQRPMPSAHDHGNNSLSENGVLVLVVAAVVLTVALGLVTCVLSHYRGGRAANPHDAAQTPTTAPMLSVVSAGATAGVGGMDRLRGRGAARELAASRDRQVRLHAVHTDIAINLPPSISLPDGEEHPFNSRLHIRDTEQESEIYQKCIRPPPNRTVLESESPPPYRSSSAGLLGSTGCDWSSSSSSSGGIGGPLVVRCHSMSSTSSTSSSSTTSTTSSSAASKRPVDAGPPGGQKTDFLQKTVKIFTGKKSQQPPPTLPPPVVVVPSRTRRTNAPTTSSSTTEQGRPRPNV